MALLEIKKASIDIGILAHNLDKMLAFYRDLLGLPEEAVIPMPGGGTMHRLKVGDSTVKIILRDPAPKQQGIPGGIPAATGYRYWTIFVGNLEHCLEKLKQEGVAIPVGPKTIREGVTIAMVEDPDGNWLELLQDDNR